jgi:ABC-type glutathione transport system ATPase component
MLVETKGLSKRYPGKKENVVSNINLAINPNETVGIIGDSGTGKSVPER